MYDYLSKLVYFFVFTFLLLKSVDAKLGYYTDLNLLMWTSSSP